MAWVEQELLQTGMNKNEAAATDSKQMPAKTQAAPDQLHPLLVICFTCNLDSGLDFQLLQT